MARNGSGTYTKAVSDFTPGQTVTASDHNTLWNDAASEITNSVAADGQTTITGPIKFASGSKAAPALTFVSDTDSGVYLSSANEVSIVCSASQVAIFAATAVNIKVPTLFSAPVTFTGITSNDTATFAGTCVFAAGFVSQGTSNFSGPFRITSATAEFANAVLMSGTATFTKGFIASQTCVFSHPILVSGTANFTKGFIASATSSFTVSPIADNLPKAWGYITWSGGTPSVTNSYNVSGLTDNDVGDVSIAIDNNLVDENYCCLATAYAGVSNVFVQISNQTSGAVRLQIVTDGGTKVDPVAVSFVIFR